MNSRESHTVNVPVLHVLSGHDRRIEIARRVARIAIAVGIPLNLLAMMLAVLLLAWISDAVGRLRRRMKR